MARGEVDRIVVGADRIARQRRHRQQDRHLHRRRAGRTATACRSTSRRRSRPSTSRRRPAPRSRSRSAPPTKSYQLAGARTAPAGRRGAQPRLRRHARRAHHRHHHRGGRPRAALRREPRPRRSRRSRASALNGRLPPGFFRSRPALRALFLVDPVRIRLCDLIVSGRASGGNRRRVFEPASRRRAPQRLLGQRTGIALEVPRRAAAGTDDRRPATPPVRSEAKEWWRRWESNPRPKNVPAGLLRACPSLVGLATALGRKALHDAAASPDVYPRSARGHPIASARLDVAPVSATSELSPERAAS